jgi:SNF family Na+-dependent transporter
MICVFLCIFKGIKLSGKITIYTATAPYFLLFILLARGVFLEGASTGLAYLLEPDLSKLFKLSVWVDAINQIFFQISLGNIQPYSNKIA